MARSSKNTGRRSHDDSATVATRAAELLRDDIVQGAIGGGERLNEVALAEGYGVSRIPLREALRIVKGQGLVEIHPFTGAPPSCSSSGGRVGSRMARCRGSV
ncbi:MAG TPA: GntR family transcriptional regulator [Candidatus Hydrogenedentes bacterium]|nr:GntR family transcriptional regulator [Candidatus Hydrogenedentota bacterium]